MDVDDDDDDDDGDSDDDDDVVVVVVVVVVRDVLFAENNRKTRLIELSRRPGPYIAVAVKIGALHSVRMVVDG